jgi:low temperature requirement protein LtrA
MEERAQPDETAAQAEQRQAEERRASYLELFFDLVFVYAITQVTALILSDTSAGGFVRSALVLGMIWWAWSAYAWLTNAIDLDTTVSRLAIVAAAAGSFFVALGVPDAYGSDGMWFAVPYLFVRLVHLLVYMYGLREDREYQLGVLRSMPFWLIAPFMIVAGALVDGDARAWIWGAAIALDIAGSLVAGRQTYRVSAAHFAERYQLFVIIAIGESIVAMAVGISGLERDLAYGVAAGVAFAGAALLWWAYFDFAGIGGERALHRIDDARRGKLARDVYTYGHFPMVAGIILFAVAAEKTVAHPGEPLSTAGRFALAAGLGSYMLAFVGTRWRIIRRVAWERAGAAVTIALVVLATAELAALAILALALAILAAWIAAEAVRLRELRRALHVG